MGDLLGSIFGSSKTTTQQQQADPVSQQLNILRYNQLMNLWGMGGFGGLLAGGGPFNVNAPYTPSPDVANLYNQAQGYLGAIPGMNSLAGSVYSGLVGLPDQMLGLGQGLAGYPQQFQNLYSAAGQYPQQFQQLYNQAQQYPAQMAAIAQQAAPYAQAMNQLYQQSQQYPAQAQAIAQGLSGYPQAFNQLAGAIGQIAGLGPGGTVTGGTSPATGGAGAATGGGGGPAPNFMTLDQYKQMGLDQAGKYIAEIAGPQLLQGFVAGGGGTGGAAQEAIAKAAAQTGMDFIKTLPQAAVQLGMLPAEYAQTMAQTGLLGAQTGLVGAQTGLTGAQTGLTRGQTALLAMQPMQAALNAQLAQLQPLQLAMQGTQMGLPMLQGGLQATMAQLDPLQAAYAATMGSLPALQGGYNALMGSMPALQGAQQAQLAQLAPLQAAQQGFLSLMQPLQYMQGLNQMGLQGTQGLMGMADYPRALAEQQLMRQQQLMLSALTGIPYTPGQYTVSGQSQPMLFGMFGNQPGLTGFMGGLAAPWSQQFA